MNINHDMIKGIRENFDKDPNFEFIAKLKDLTLLDIDCIEKMFTSKSKLTYQIVDNMYIKIHIHITNEE